MNQWGFWNSGPPSASGNADGSGLDLSPTESLDAQPPALYTPVTGQVQTRVDLILLGNASGISGLQKCDPEQPVYMDEKGRNRRDDVGNTGAGIRVPVPGESSSPGTSAPLDSPTIIDIPGRKLADIPIRNISAGAPTVVGGA